MFLAIVGLASLSGTAHGALLDPTKGASAQIIEAAGGDSFHMSMDGADSDLASHSRNLRRFDVQNFKSWFSMYKSVEKSPPPPPSPKPETFASTSAGGSATATISPLPPPKAASPKPPKTTIRTEEDSAFDSDSPCGEPIFDVDIAGYNIGEGRALNSLQSCLDLCEVTPNCNAVSRDHKRGRCWLKNIPNDHVKFPHENFNSFILCPDTEKAVAMAKGVSTAATSNFYEADSRSKEHPDSSPHVELPPEPVVSSSASIGGTPRPLEQGMHALFDYQVNTAYNPTLGTRVVARDWFYGKSLYFEASYSICYINAFQTEVDCEGCDRPDVTSNWPKGLVLHNVEDPAHAGQYVIDISTPEKRSTASKHVYEMLKVCKDKTFDAVEFANLDSFVKYETVPFTRDDTVAYAKMIVKAAHDMGLAAAQKDAIELIDSGDYTSIGFDFALTERCGELKECAQYKDAYNGLMVGVEYTEAGFVAACEAVHETSAVVLRDEGLSAPDDEQTYVVRQCGPMDPVMT